MKSVSHIHALSLSTVSQDFCCNDFFNDHDDNFCVIYDKVKIYDFCGRHIFLRPKSVFYAVSGATHERWGIK